MSIPIPQWCYNLQFHQQCMSVLFPSHPHQHFLLFIFSFIIIFYFYRLHFDSLYTNEVHLFVSKVVHSVDSYHLCNHTCTQGNEVCLIPPFFIPSPSHFPLHNLKFLHSSLTPHPPPPFIYHHPFIRENIQHLVFLGLAYFTQHDIL